MTITAFDLASLAYTAARLAIERTGRSRGTVAARHRLIRKARRAMVAADSLVRQLDDGSGPAADMPPRDPETGLPVWYVQLWPPAGRRQRSEGRHCGRASGELLEEAAGRAVFFLLLLPYSPSLVFPPSVGTWAAPL